MPSRPGQGFSHPLGIFDNPLTTGQNKQVEGVFHRVAMLSL
ncbi:MAG: hypothetical protein ACKOX2_20090 [Microcystaceae cyanobacterium]